jgi:glycosyltransferase involved in cell wall biosynthesis
MERKPAVAIVFHHIGPYHHARLNAAAETLSVTGIEWSGQSYEPWGAADSPARYPKVSLFSQATDTYPQTAELRRAFSSAIEQAKPDVVAVNGWNNFGSVVAANCCVRRGIPMVVMSESSRHDERRTSWKETVKRRIIDLYSAALVGGQRHVEYLIELGMPRERIFTGYDVVDNDYFARRVAEARRSKSEIRNQRGLPQNYFLASARFVKKKNLSRLITAYGDYRRKVQNTENAIWDLVLLGDGPLRDCLKSQLSTLNLNEHVHLPGFRPYEELPVYYALANALVHASSTEQWGLVVNEAVASGLPVIVSDRCGCVPELVNGNGFIFDPTNESELTARMLELASLSHGERKQLSDNSYEIAANFSPERFGKGLEQAANIAMRVPQKRFGVMGRALLFVTASYAR